MLFSRILQRSEKSITPGTELNTRFSVYCSKTRSSLQFYGQKGIVNKRSFCSNYYFSLRHRTAPNYSFPLLSPTHFSLQDFYFHNNEACIALSFDPMEVTPKMLPYSLFYSCASSKFWSFRVQRRGSHLFCPITSSQRKSYTL